MIQAVQIDPMRYKQLEHEFSLPYFAAIKNTLLEERQTYTIYPPAAKIFAAYDMTPFDKVKVVILWQDPYHGPGQAMWLSFSVPPWCAVPPSLKNMYKEIQEDTGAPSQCAGQVCAPWDLTARAKQWVLLLNAFLTVRAGDPASHQKIGRENFTDATIRTVSESRDHVVFILRGNFAKSKKALIDTSKHLVLEAAHPSPFSAYSGFFGSQCFSKCNAWLEEKGMKGIIW